MKKNGFGGIAWLACLALLVQGLAACSTTDSITGPTSQDDATIQKVEVVDDGTGGGGTPPDTDDDNVQDYVGDGTGKTPSSPDTEGGTER